MGAQAPGAWIGEASLEHQPVLAMPKLTNLGPHFYVDPGLYEAERRTIFQRHW